MDVDALAKAAAEKAAEAVREAHRVELRQAEEARRRAEERAAELKRLRTEAAKKKAWEQQKAEREKAAEEERQRAAEAQRKAAADASRKRGNTSAPAKGRTASNAAGKSSASAAGMSERAAGKLPQRDDDSAAEYREPAHQDEDDGEDDEEDLMPVINPVGEMDTWMEVMDHAEKLGMPKWAQSLSIRLFELDRDQAQMENRLIPQLSRMTARVERVRGRYDGIERQLEELSETVHDGLERINRRMDEFEQEMRSRMEKVADRFDKRMEAVRYEWREGLYRQNGSVADRISEYGERLNRWHDRFAELEVIVGAHVPDRDNFTIDPPARPPSVIRIPRLPDDDEDLASIQQRWIADEFRLGYTGEGKREEDDGSHYVRRVPEDAGGDDGESGSPSPERTPRLRPVSNYAPTLRPVSSYPPPPVPRAEYPRTYAFGSQLLCCRSLIFHLPAADSRAIVCTLCSRPCC